MKKKEKQRKQEKTKETGKPRVGDIVEVDLVKKTYKGTLLESPEPGIILLKLESGYNLGFQKKELLDLRVLKKTVETKEEEIEIKSQTEKPGIAVIMTGGTISSELDTKTGAVKWLTTPEKLFKFYPEIFEVANVVNIEVPFMKGSEYMNFRDWKKLAKTVFKFLRDPKVNGIIITHGTDTLHYTAAALSFFLRNLNKPVVLTYSQRSTDRASSDAALNLRSAAVAAISDICEVVVVGHATSDDETCYVLRGTKTRKLHSSRRDAFKPVNIKPLAEIKGNTLTPISDFNSRTEKGKPKLEDKFEEKVALVKVYPGQSPEILDYYVRKKYRGVILEVFGLGHLPGKEWVSKIKEANEKGIVVCAAAQTIYGRLNPLVYSTGRELEKSELIFLRDMLAETAFVKLGWVLGKTKNREEAEKLMLTNLAREFNNRLEE